MINRVTGEIDFSSGLRILPHCSVQSLSTDFGPSLKVETHTLSHKEWKRHVLGFHNSEHGNFEVEALSGEDDCIQLVLLSHWHPFYELGTPEDAERRAFHEGVVSSDLGGQRDLPGARSFVVWSSLPIRIGSSSLITDSPEYLSPRKKYYCASARMSEYLMKKTCKPAPRDADLILLFLAQRAGAPELRCWS